MQIPLIQNGSPILLSVVATNTLVKSPGLLLAVERLEPYAWWHACTVLRGGNDGNVVALPDNRRSPHNGYGINLLGSYHPDLKKKLEPMAITLDLSHWYSIAGRTLLQMNRHFDSHWLRMAISSHRCDKVGTEQNNRGREKWAFQKALAEGCTVVVQKNIEELDDLKNW